MKQINNLHGDILYGLTKRLRVLTPLRFVVSKLRFWVTVSWFRFSYSRTDIAYWPLAFKIRATLTSEFLDAFVRVIICNIFINNRMCIEEHLLSVNVNLLEQWRYTRLIGVLPSPWGMWASVIRLFVSTVLCFYENMWTSLSHTLRCTYFLEPRRWWLWVTLYVCVLESSW